MNEQLSEILRLLRNLIRIGTVSEVNLSDGKCRVDTGNNTTGWLHWLSARAGKTRSWNAPSVGEQVLVLCLGGELDTGFVLPGVYSDANPAPSASADALHWSFPDGAVIEYEPKSGALTATGIQTATISAAVKILFDAPEVECTKLLKAAQLEVTEGGTMKGDITHTGGSLSSNGKALLAERKATLISLYPEEQQEAIARTLSLESEPIVKLLQENAYRELILRERINEAAKGVMLPYAMDGDLDQLGANNGIERLTITPADDTTIPPTPAVMESNDDFRARIAAAFEGLSVAGPTGAYEYHAKSVDGRVADASAISPPLSPSPCWRARETARQPAIC